MDIIIGIAGFVVFAGAVVAAACIAIIILALLRVVLAIGGI